MKIVDTTATTTLAPTGPWISTYTGRCFSLDAPRVDDVDILDIARGGSHCCRYAGQSRRFYCVDEHAVYVSLRVKELGGTVSEQFEGLMHDAAESYVGDATRPMKRLVPALVQAEHVVFYAIAQRFGIPAKMSRLVKQADDDVLAIEKCWPGLLTPNPHMPDRRPVDSTLQIRILPPDEAMELFLQRFEALTNTKVVR